MENSAAYKRRHEEFVTGLTGGSISEIYFVSLTAPLGILTWSILHRYYGHSMGSLPKLAIDFVLNWLALFLAITIYASNLTLLYGLLVLPGLALLLTGLTGITKVPVSTKPDKPTTSNVAVDLPRRPFLTVYRANMMIITCTAILAVDFRIFPRRFAKVEDWGTSLMDMGVGAFVFSMGLVSSRAVLIDSLRSYSSRSLGRSLVTSLKHSGPVLVLGLIRLFFVKFFNYQEHVSEYGVHWNFFMTLGFLPPFVALIGALPERLVPTGLLALFIGGVYELSLTNDNFRAYLLTAERVDLLSQNREGVFSFVGYLSIFLIGRSTGYYTLPTTVSFRNLFYPPKRTNHRDSRLQDSRPRSIVMLGLSTLFHTALLQVLLQWGTPSRRLANLPYVLFVVSFNTFFLALFILIDWIFFPAPTSPGFRYLESVPYSLEAINFNGLLIFLLANVATGIINMNLHTLDVSTEGSVGVLTLYLLGLFGISIWLYKTGIRIKI